MAAASLLGATLAEWQKRREEEAARRREAARVAQQEKNAEKKAEQARLAYLNAAYQAKLDREKAQKKAAAPDPRLEDEELAFLKRTYDQTQQKANVISSRPKQAANSAAQSYAAWAKAAEQGRFDQQAYVKAAERAKEKSTPLLQQAWDTVKTVAQKVTNSMSNAMAGAWYLPYKAGIYKLPALVKDSDLPTSEPAWWEKVKEWWRVRTIKLDHPTYPPADAGSGEHGVRVPILADFAFEKILQAGAMKFRLDGYDDAARQMSHYLGNSGRELKTDVNEMMTEMPNFEIAVQKKLEGMLIENLVKADLTNKTELNFESEWTDFYAYQDVSPNWFYAMGGYYYWVGANAKLISPQTEENSHVIKVVYKIAVSDYYNWDAGKATSFDKPEGIAIPPLPEAYEGKIVDLGDKVIIYDTALAELHKVGIAQEFHIAGETGKLILYYEYNPATSELTLINPK